MGIVTLEEARTHLKIDQNDTDDDPVLTSYIDGITQPIESYLHKPLVPRAVTEDVRLHCASASFWLGVKPVISLTSLVTVDGTVTYDVANFTVRSNGQVWVVNGPYPYGVVTAVYQAGYSEIPDGYKSGALTVLQYLWEGRRNAGQSTGGMLDAEEYHSIRQAASDFIRRARVWFGETTTMAR